MSADEPEECDNVETRITKHFTRLYGVLQNVQAKLMEKLYQLRSSMRDNLKEIKMQLREQKEQLNVALKLAVYTKENFNSVDVRNAIKILNEIADLPCHLVRNNCTQAILFDDNEEMLVELLENHHSLRVPQVSRYELRRTETLPEDYKVDPLVKTLENPFVTNMMDQNLLSKMMKSSVENISFVPSESTIVESEIARLEKTLDNNITTNHQVEVIRINNPSSFFVRYFSSKTEFAQLEKDLRAYVKACNEKSPPTLCEGDTCIVKQKASDNWYRGHVIDMSDSLDRMYSIFYIDYGFKESNIPVSRICSISEEHMKLQPQAIRCCLYGVMPVKNTWTAKSIRDFTKLLSKTSIFMHIIKYSQNMLHVDICTVSSEGNNMGPQSICNAMIFMKHAHNNTRTYPSNKTNVYGKEELVLYKNTIVTVSYIKSPAEIYVLKKGQWNDSFLKLLDDLKEYYEDDTLKNTCIISTPEKGLPCAVQHIDNLWYRCEIVKVISKDRVEVFFVDKGYTLTLDCDVLRAIPYKYTLFKAQAIKISLRYVNPDSDGTWKAKSVDILSSIFDSMNSAFVTAIQKTQDGYSCRITMFNGSDVGQLLRSKGVVNSWKHKPLRKAIQRDTDIKELLDNSVKELSELEVSDFDTKSIEEEISKDPFKMEIYIKRVVTPECIYVAQKDHEESNSNLIEAMQQFYNNYCSEQRDNWSENALCAVYSAKDKAYFRAQIVEIKSSTKVLVYFCDMGIVETVTIKDIQVLHQQFTKQPAHCFKVKLAGILPCGGSSAWPSLSISKLTDIIRENSRCKFFITKLIQQDDICDDIVIPVELWVRQLKIPGPLEPVKIEVNCINKMLVDEGVVLPIKDYFTTKMAVLNAELKRQLLSSQLISSDEVHVQWFDKDTCDKINCKINNSSSSLSCESDLLNQACSIDTSKKKNEHPKRVTDWLPPDEIKEEVFYAMPTNVDYKGDVYLHTVNQSELLNLINSELQNYIKFKKLKIYKQWKEGDICIAKYHRDNKWYRAKVLQVSHQINDRIKLHVLFVDYGNEEECELEDVTRDIRMDYIPIQSTKCVISGLSPDTSSGNWTRTDLDRLHMILVDHEIKVYVLQRQPTHLVVSITLLHKQCNLLSFLALTKSKIDMKIKIEPKNWNDIIICEESNSILNTTINSTVTEEMTNYEAADTSKKSSMEMETSNIMFKENVISGSFIEAMKPEYNNNDTEIANFENISDIFPMDDCVISSTPQNESEESLGEYKPLIIPLNTKYVELILCCNKNPTTSYAYLAENNDDMFSDILHDYYMQYENITLDIQESASLQPLIESFESNTSCITKFTDGRWYRCVIMQSQKIPDTQCIHIMVHYIDYGNNEYKIVDLSTKNHDLHVPKKEWIQLPAMAIECQFWNIDFISDDVDLLASKLDKVYNKVVVAQVKEIKENILVAEIYKNKMCQELLYAHLVDEGLYQYKKV